MEGILFLRNGVLFGQYWRIPFNDYGSFLDWSSVWVKFYTMASEWLMVQRRETFGLCCITCEIWTEPGSTVYPQLKKTVVWQLWRKIKGKWLVQRCGKSVKHLEELGFGSFEIENSAAKCQAPGREGGVQADIWEEFSAPLIPPPHRWLWRKVVIRSALGHLLYLCNYFRIDSQKIYPLNSLSIWRASIVITSLLLYPPSREAKWRQGYRGYCGSIRE